MIFRILSPSESQPAANNGCTMKAYTGEMANCDDCKYGYNTDEGCITTFTKCFQNFKNVRTCYSCTIENESLYLPKHAKSTRKSTIAHFAVGGMQRPDLAR